MRFGPNAGMWKSVCPMVLLVGWMQPSAEPLTTKQQRAIESRHNAPLSFEANQGQFDPQVRFVSRGSGSTLFLTGEELVFLFRSSKKASAPGSPNADLVRSVLRLRLGGAGDRIQGEGKIPSVSNYFLGNDQSNWRTGIPHYSSVRYANVYTGIDLLLHGDSHRQMEFDFLVSPQADPGKISLKFDGIETLTVGPQGELEMHWQNLQAAFKQPYVFQMIEGKRKKVEASYVIREAGDVGFSLGEYDPAESLVIDPTLIYSTFLGGSGPDEIRDIAVDSAGSTYVAGITFSEDFPLQGGLGTFPGDPVNAFVSKFNADGDELVYSTYLGGRNFDQANGIAVDSNGSAYVTGGTESDDFPDPNSFHGNFEGDRDCFVAKLNLSGAELIYSGFAGGGDRDECTDIDVDQLGQAYVTGYSQSQTLELPNGRLDTGLGGPMDGFLVKVNATGGEVVFWTFLGGEAEDGGEAVRVDSAGANAFVTGFTSSDDYPTEAPFQPGLDGVRDAFVTKVAGDGSRVVYSTFLGGGAFDTGNAIDVDSQGNAYVAGSTKSTDFPTVNPFQGTFQGGTTEGTGDGFIARFNPSGSELDFSTYLGGESNDDVTGISVNPDGEVSFCGETASMNFPTEQPVRGEFAGGLSDAVAGILAADGSGLLFSTFLGGSSQDSASGIATDLDGNLFVSGTTNSSLFPRLNAFQNVLGGETDGFVAKISRAGFGNELIFAQFADGQQGDISISSTLLLYTLDSGPALNLEPVSITIQFRDIQGGPMTVDINGTAVIGRLDLAVPAGGAVALETDGLGPLQTGSVIVTSSRPLDGSILFRGQNLGLEGVPPSQRLNGFRASVFNQSPLSTGVALAGLGNTQDLELELRDLEGNLVARATESLGAGQQDPRFINQYSWDTPPNFANFKGTLTVRGTFEFAATLLLQEPNGLSAVPVTKLQ